MSKMVWREISGDMEGVEIPIGKIVDLKCVAGNCCETSNLWFQRIDVSPVTDWFQVVCKSCGKKGDSTDWSWERAIAFWNVSLWNPKYMGRDPLKLADRIERLELDAEKITLKDMAEVASILKEAPRYLRAGVHNEEAAKIELFINKEEEEEE